MKLLSPDHVAAMCQFALDEPSRYPSLGVTIKMLLAGGATGITGGDVDQVLDALHTPYWGWALVQAEAHAYGEALIAVVDAIGREEAGDA